LRKFDWMMSISISKDIFCRIMHISLSSEKN